MKSIRIGNDIRIEWPIVLSGDVSKLRELHLTVEVRPSARVIDTRNYVDAPVHREATVLMNGGIASHYPPPPHGAMGQPCSGKPLPPHGGCRPAPVLLPYHIEDNTLIALWTADRQFATGDYDILLYARKDEGGQAVCDQYRFVRLVSHTAEADLPVGSGIEAVIAMQPVTLQLSGLSAYEVAVVNGFQGTEKEWLESLRQPGETKNIIGEVLLSELDTLGISDEPEELLPTILGERGNVFKVLSAEGGPVVGILEVLSDGMCHVVTQVLTTHYVLDGGEIGGTHDDGKIYTYYRSYGASQGSGQVPVGEWTQWSELLATTSANGLMSKEDKSKLDGIDEDIQSALGNVPLAFDGIVDDDITVQSQSTVNYTSVLWSSKKEKFIAKGSDGLYYSNWGKTDRYGEMNDYIVARLYVLTSSTTASVLGINNSVYARVRVKNAFGGEWVMRLMKVGEVNSDSELSDEEIDAAIAEAMEEQGS